MRRFPVFVQLLLATLFRETCAVTIQHKQLEHDLLSKYGGRYLRPVKNFNSSVPVYFRAKPFHFVDFDEERQLLTFTSRTQIKWTDELLTWNPNDYGGVEKIPFSKSQIWFPDITTYERIGTGPVTTNINEPIIMVNHLGQAVYYEIMQLTVFCKMNVRLFPFDSHGCTQRYTSYGHDGKDLRLRPTQDSSASEIVAVRNGIWYLKDFKVKEIVQYYLCCPNPFVEIQATIFIQRESSFYVFNIGIPTLFLSLITLSVFFLHPESGERISLSVSNVLALVIFQQLVSASMPPTGDHTPIIAYYFAVTISISFASVISTTITVRLYLNEGTKPPPYVVRRLLKGKSFNLRRPSEINMANFSERTNHKTKRTSDRAGVGGRVYPLAIRTNELGVLPSESAFFDTSLMMEQEDTRGSLPHRCRSGQTRELPGQTSDTPQNGEYTSYADEWKRAAVLLDRVMFTLSLTGMLVAIVFCSFFIVTELGNSQEIMD